MAGAGTNRPNGPVGLQPPRGSARRVGPELVQIDKVGLEDVFLTNRATGFGLSIPSIQWTGFKADKGKVELGQLKIDSDRLTVETKPGRSVEVEGKQVAFQKLLEGSVLPKLGKSLRRAVGFTVDVDCPEGKLSAWITAFDGKLQAWFPPGGGGHVSCKDLDLTDYFDSPLPRALNLQAGFAVPSDDNKKNRLESLSGSFQLGRAAFDVEPLPAASKDSQTSETRLSALGHGDSIEYHYSITCSNELWAVSQSLTAAPEMSPRDMMARLFAGKRYAELDPAVQKDMDAKLGFFGAKPAAAPEGKTVLEAEKP